MSAYDVTSIKYAGCRKATPIKEKLTGSCFISTRECPLLNLGGGGVIVKPDDTELKEGGC